MSLATSSAATRAPVRMATPLRGDGLRHRLGDGAHAALRQREAGGVAGGLAGEAVEQQHQRVRRARPHPGAEHGVVGEDALQPVVAELVVEHVGDVREQDAQELAQVVAAHGAQLQAEHRELRGLVAGAPGEARRGEVPERLQRAGVAQQPGAQRRPGGAVGRGAETLAEGAVEAQVVAGRRERGGGEVDRREGEAVAGELEARLDTRVEEVQQVRDGADAVAARELDGPGGAADTRAGLEQQHAAAGAREAAGGGKAVAAAPDDDGVKGRHRLRSCRGLACGRRAGSRRRRCGRGRP